MTIREQGDLVIVDMHGDLVLTKSREALRETIGKLTDAGPKTILLNLGDIAELDENGGRDLLRQCASIVGNGNLTMLNVGRQVKRRPRQAGLRRNIAPRENIGSRALEATPSAAARAASGSDYFG
jgi:anti-anti-sigma regulatory factor